MYRLSIIVIVGLTATVPARDDIPPPRRVADVAELVRRLGSDEFADREEASRRLATLDVDDVPAELLAATRSPDPEVRERAGKAVKALREHIALNREKAAARHLPRGERFAKLGQIDLYVASTAAPTDRKADDDRLWLPAYEAGCRAVAEAEMTGDRKPQGGPTWFKALPTYRAKRPGLRFVRTDELHARPSNTVSRPEAVQAAGVTDPGSIAGLVISRGPVRATLVIGESLILATGDVTCGDNLSNSVVVCDGDVHVRGHVLTSLVIARGKITVGGEHVDASTLIAGQAVTFATPPKPVPKSSEPLIQAAYDSRRVVVAESEVRPLGYITFFELSTVGVEVKAADGKEMRVTAVAEGKAFARAGVRVGDVVAGVGGKRPDSVEALRRLLRDALAVGDAKITLTRDGKPVAATVALPE